MTEKEAEEKAKYVLLHISNDDCWISATSAWVIAELAKAFLEISHNENSREVNGPG
jgi:hypothetical protein